MVAAVKIVLDAHGIAKGTLNALCSAANVDENVVGKKIREFKESVLIVLYLLHYFSLSVEKERNSDETCLQAPY